MGQQPTANLFGINNEGAGMPDVYNIPAIPGVTFRPFRGEGDFAAIASILTASEAADQNIRHLTSGEVAASYQHLVNCDATKDMLMAQVL
jgi:hypothetical protein